MKRVCQTLFLSFLFLSNNAVAQKTDTRLQRQIAALVRDYHGGIGVYVHDLQKNRIAAVNAGDTFPTASMIKVPILISTMDKISRGELGYEQKLMYRDSLLYPGDDILGSFKEGEQIELGKVMMLMLTMSDNTASLWLQSLAGTGTRINRIMDSLGMKITRVNSRTPGREADQKRFGWGQTSPYEMASLMEGIVKKQIISDSASEKMLRLLGRNFWDTHAISQIPSDVFVADKNGAVDDSRSEVMFVNGKGRRYIFCICTKNNVDQSWTAENEAWRLTQKISRLLWEYYK